MGDNKLKDEELEQINGGMSDEEYKLRQENERKLHGRIVRDAFGNVTFTDKTGITGQFSAEQWNKLRTNWDYTGNPEYYMETINVGELQGMMTS